MGKNEEDLISDLFPYTRAEIKHLISALKDDDLSYVDLISLYQELDLLHPRVKFKSCFKGYFSIMEQLRLDKNLKGTKAASLFMATALRLYLHAL